MTPRELLTRCAAAGITLAAEAGRLRVAGPAEAVREFTPLLREHRDELLALLGQGAQAADDPLHAEGPSVAPDPAGQAADPGTPCGNAWREADAAYQRHHWACSVCSSAGRGYGSRCPQGARLWAAYTAQPSPATSKPARQPQASPEPPRYPFERERRAWTPASDAEIERMAALHARAVEFGLDPQQADCAADVAHWSDRLGNTRLCLACAHLRAGTASRWHCVAQRLPLAERFVLQPHRCPQFSGLETKRGNDA
ncbi:hypothetical protein Talka_02130 [Tepidimonas alkaliphilus]|uniref:TubC N-terminal docking domain-containing protein n=1 Tax=Tepidimonas alkaliphilus TaxID=2588942 RepID=A0A554W4I5_9BURK|nr:hypothetical protein [Tepidimonas alkaliphilus]TSE18487.1 hypothetical protein Talka_02130 [Tepidimonas alkaliphilus]